MFDSLFRKFESRVQATALPPAGAPPPGLIAFYWHFVRQTRVLFLGMLLSCLLVALSDTVMPVLIGKLVALMTATERQAAVRNALNYRTTTVYDERIGNSVTGDYTLASGGIDRGTTLPVLLRSRSRAGCANSSNLLSSLEQRFRIGLAGRHQRCDSGTSFFGNLIAMGCRHLGDEPVGAPGERREVVYPI